MLKATNNLLSDAFSIGQRQINNIANMELDFFETATMTQELEKIPPLHRLVFAASICERLLPNYDVYHRTEEWGTREPPDPSELRKILDRIWRVVAREILDAKDVDALLKICDGMLRNRDDAQSIHYTDGINAVDAICHTLEACLEPTPKNIIRVVNDVTLTIADFIYLEEESIDPGWSDRPEEEIEEELNNLREQSDVNANRSVFCGCDNTRKDPKNLEAANDVFDSYPQSC